MVNPSEEDFALLGKILFYVLILPVLFYYIFQGIKFCFNFVFSTHDNSSKKSTDVVGYTLSPELPMPDEKGLSKCNEEGYAVYVVFTLPVQGAYSTQGIFSFFSKSPQSYSGRLEQMFDPEHIDEGRRSFYVLLENRVYSNLEDAQKKFSELNCADDIIFGITSDAKKYRIMKPQLEEERATNTRLDTLFSNAKSMLGEEKEKITKEIPRCARDDNG